MGKKFLAAMVSFLMFGVASAEKIVLTPQKSVELAMENNSSLKQSSIGLKTRQREKKYSWNGIGPSASVSANYSSTLPSKEGSRDSVSLGASVSANLTTSLYTQIKGAEIALEQQKITYEQAVKDIQLAVYKSYYNILYGQENLNLSRKNLDTKRKQYEANKEKFNRGMLSKVDVLSAQINCQNTELDVEQKKMALDNSIEQFKLVLGIGLGSELEFTGDFRNLYDVEKINVDGIDPKSSSISSLEKQLESAKNSLLALRFGAYSPSLSAGYSYTNTYDANGFNKISDGGSLRIGATIPLDGLLPWSRNSVQIEAQKDNIESLGLKLVNERVNFQIESDILVKKINQCIKNIKVRKNGIDLAETNYNMTYEAYNHGIRDLLTLQAAQDNLLSSRVSLVSEANTLIATVFELENKWGLEYGSLLGDIK
ncbi:TolC family protein [Treponema sp.]|uniref:TolC family protein n=1 Tax=Treponema sp. TaxID=166 RepID=UPI00388D2EA1